MNGSKKVKTPVMGWTSQYFGPDINEAIIRKQAKAIISNGMAKAGYVYVIIHDGWYNGSDSEGIITSDVNKFGDMGRFVRELKDKGLKVGLYVTAGEGKGGIGGQHLQQNCSRICIEWGVELLTIGNMKDKNQLEKITEAIGKTGRHPIIDICPDGAAEVRAATGCDQWTLYDVLEPDYYDLTRDRLDTVIEGDASQSITKERAGQAGPGHYYNVGNMPLGKGMTVWQDQAIFSEFCILTCPLIIGTDLTKASEETIKILTNSGAIGLNQDPSMDIGSCARYYDPWHCLYKKELSDGSMVFLMLNRCHHPKTFTLEADIDLNISKDTLFEVYDLWNGKAVGTFNDVYSIPVETSDNHTVPCSYLYKVTIKK